MDLRMQAALLPHVLRLDVPVGGNVCTAGVIIRDHQNHHPPADDVVAVDIHA